MKRDAPTHPKMYALADGLGIEQFAAVGIMELLWHWTARQSPNGDVGRHGKDLTLQARAIARAVCWPTDDATTLVDELCKAKWLDEPDLGKIFVHDWPQHCEDSIHTLLARKVEHFADGSRPKLTKLNQSERERIDMAFDEKEALAAQKCAGRRIPAHDGAGQCAQTRNDQAETQTADNKDDADHAQSGAFLRISAQECALPLAPSPLHLAPSQGGDSAPTRESPDAGGDPDPPPFDPLGFVPAKHAPRFEALLKRFADYAERSHPKTSKPPRDAAGVGQWAKILAGHFSDNGAVAPFSFDEFEAALVWLFDSPSADAIFWRGQIREPADLDRAKSGKPNRIGQIFEARQQDLDHAKSKKPKNPKPKAVYLTAEEAKKWDEEEDAYSDAEKIKAGWIDAPERTASQ